ncbi:MAG TPA: hypothetical protein VHN77_14650 [Phycisphaerales bacterium]|nr:hypothetical protein [Phycisphaerales bacterium]
MLARMAGRHGVPLQGDDLAQETFERFYEKGLDRRVDASKGSARTLLFGVLRNVFLEAVRAEGRERRARSRGARAEAPAPDPLSVLLQTERLEWLRGCWPGLSEREREEMTKFYGALFDGVASKEQPGHDRAVTCRTRKRIRKQAKRKGLMED